MGRSIPEDGKHTLILRGGSARTINAAATILKKGGVVAFPTETVYGLGANAYSPESVRKIFRIKGRPADNPLIVHVSSMKQFHEITGERNEIAEKLARRFWPGPLTIVLKKSERIPGIVTANLQTVAVRMPSHPVARRLIAACGFPIAAPSANLSGRTSPTNPDDVVEDLFGKVDAIIYAGSSGIGLESTVIDFDGDTIRILRPGCITPKQLRKASGCKVVVATHAPSRPISPGMKYRHYSTIAPLYVVRNCAAAEKLAKRASRNGKMVLLKICGKRHSGFAAEIRLGETCARIARNLYAAMRRADRMKPAAIVVECPPPEGIGLAISNRLHKAAAQVIR